MMFSSRLYHEIKKIDILISFTKLLIDKINNIAKNY